MTDPEGLQAPEEGTQEHPDWFRADKYDSYEAQAKAYGEAESRMNEAIQRERDAKERADRLEEQIGELAELIQEQPRQAQFQPEQDAYANPLLYAYQQAAEQGDTFRMLQIQNQMTQALIDERLSRQQAQNGSQQEENDDQYEVLAAMAEDSLRRKYGEEYDKLRDKTVETLQERPYLLAGGTLGDVTRALDDAFGLAQRGDLLGARDQSLAQQQQAAEAARQRKIQAESLTGGGPTRTAPKDEQEAYWEKLKAVDTGEFRLGYE